MLSGKELPKWTLDELNTISHREYTTGFYYGRDGQKQTYIPGGYVHEWELSAMAVEKQDDRLIVCEQNKFAEGDTLELLNPGQKPISFVVTNLRNDKDEHIELINHPEDLVSMDFPYEAMQGAVLRRKK